MDDKKASFERMLKSLFLAVFLPAFFLQACSSDPAQPVFEKAERSFGQGEYAGAIEKYASVVSRFNKSPLAAKSQQRIALIYDRTGDTQRALEAYSTLFYMFPESPVLIAAKQDLARIYSREGEHWKALGLYQKLMEEKPEDRARFQYLAAMEYMKMNDFRQARIEFEELLNYASAQLKPRIRYQIADTYYIEGDLKEAMGRYDELISNPGDGEVAVEARFSKALALDESGRPVEALNLLKALEADYPNKAAIRTKIDWIEKRVKESPAGAHGR